MCPFRSFLLQSYGGYFSTLLFCGSIYVCVRLNPSILNKMFMFFAICFPAGLPEPEYDFVTHFVCLTIRFKSPLTPRLSGDKVNDNRNDRPNDSRIDRLSDSVKKTYQIIRDNPGIQRKRISELADKSIPTIDRHIAILVKIDLIEHRDSDRNGGYFVK